MDFDESLNGLRAELRQLEDLQARQAEHEPDWVQLEAMSEALPTDHERAQWALQISNFRRVHMIDVRLGTLQQRVTELTTLAIKMGEAVMDCRARVERLEDD